MNDKSFFDDLSRAMTDEARRKMKIEPLLPTDWTWRRLQKEQGLTEYQARKALKIAGERMVAEGKAISIWVASDGGRPQKAFRPVKKKQEV